MNSFLHFLNAGRNKSYTADSRTRRVAQDCIEGPTIPPHIVRGISARNVRLQVNLCTLCFKLLGMRDMDFNARKFRARTLFKGQQISIDST